MNNLKQLTTKERLLFFWRGEVEARYQAWKKSLQNIARRTLEEVEKGNSELIGGGTDG